MSWFTDREEKRLAEIEVSLKKNADFISSIGSTVGVCTLELPAASTCTVGWSGLIHTAYNDYDMIKPIKPTLNEIICKGCGSSSIKETNIPGIVECSYCGKQFTLSY